MEKLYWLLKKDRSAMVGVLEGKDKQWRIRTMLGKGCGVITQKVKHLFICRV